jgi:NADP-dependent 3-hydroxy acid dehydrogenase YdfG
LHDERRIMRFNLKPIREQVIVITGASSGIGMATALRAAEEGAKVVLAARSENALASIADQIRSKGGEAIHVAADVANREHVERVAAKAIDRFGRFDTWVNDAGVAIYGRLDQVTDEDSRRLFDINFWGVVNGSLVALDHLRARGGSLINVGSEVSDAVVPLQGMYTASKHAVKGFTDALRVEVEQVDHAPVSITLIQPTAVNTPYPEHAKNYMDKEPKLPRPIDPYKVAKAILHAAEHHVRDVKVGARSVVNTTVARLVPKIGDALSAMVKDKQHYDEPPRNPRGTLDQAGESGRVYGSGPREGTASR